TDDLYLNYLARFVKPGGAIGIAGAGLMGEIDGPVPAHLQEWWTADLWCLHSPPWWRRHWERTGIVEVTRADALPEGWQFWVDWLERIAPENLIEIQALKADAGRHLGYVRAMSRRRADVPLPEHVVSVATQYQKRP